MKTAIDDQLGFSAYDWRSRYRQVANLAKEDLTNRGFKVNFVKLYEAEDINKESDSGLVISWSVSPVL